MGYTIKRWRRGRQDRGYASDEQGQPLGYIDLVKGTVHLDPGAPASLDAYLRSWAAQLSHTVHTSNTEAKSVVVPDVAPAPISPVPTGTDLAWNAAGHSAAAKAQSEWAAYAQRRPHASKVARFLRLETPDRSWNRGAAGEREVGAKLDRLRAHGWYVLHSVPIGKNGADIDHVVIGPAGVFCINTKNHSRANVWVSPKAFMVNGQHTQYYRNSRTEAQRVSRILTRATGWTIDVTPVIIVMAQRYTDKGQPSDVAVVGRRHTPRVFLQLPHIYSQEAVETIFRVARDSATWDET